MRVANLMLGAGRGGLEQAAVDFAEALRIGEVPALTLTVPDAWANVGLDAAGLERTSIVVGGPFDIGKPWRLAKALRDHRPTHLVCHGNKALKLAAHPVVKRALPNARVVGVTHNYSLRHMTRADHVMALTGGLASAALSAGVAEDRLHRIGNLVRVPPVLPSARAGWGHPPVIGALGRFVPKKGFEIFIDALALLEQSGRSFRAVLGGEGDEAPALRARALARGLGDRLSMPGWIDDRQAFFDGIDIAVVPSHHEPFGIVVLEAMAQGVPVIATASEGPSEILADARCGVLVPLRDPQAIADALGRLLDDAAQAKALGMEGHAIAREVWDITPAARRLAAALGAMV